MKKPKIKFSHDYTKFLGFEGEKTYLIGVSKVKLEDLPKKFIKYDTHYYDGVSEIGFYPLPNKGDYLLLTLYTYVEWWQHGWLSAEQVWTTLRKWTPEKEKKYKALVGQEVEIVIE